MRAPLLAAWLLAAATQASASQEVMDGAAALHRLAQQGRLVDAMVTGDLNLEGLRHPTGGVLSLQNVRVSGSLRNTPAAPLEISSQSVIGGLRTSGTVWHHPLTIERTTFTDRVGLDGTRFEKPLACRRCRFEASVSALRARFGDDVDFSFSEFLGPANFSAARFRAAAFDGARFADARGPRFDEAEFAGGARFVGIDTGEAPVFFLGTTFREEALFRGCRVGRGVFAPAPAPPGDGGNPFTTAVTSFGGLADFRRCTFRAGADFSWAALRLGARFDGASLSAGTLDLSRLTQAGGQIVLRGISLWRGVTITADETSIDDVVADSALLVPTRWRALSPDAVDVLLDGLAARARTLGAPTESRHLAYVAAAQRATAPGAAWDEARARALATWALQWPTQNSTDLGRPLLIGAALWLIAFAASVRRGVLATSPSDDKPPANPLARVLDSLHRPLADLEAGAWCPATPRGQAGAAASYGFALVFKLGTRRWRPAEAGGWRPPVLAVLWLLGFVLVALIGITAIRLLPVLSDLAGAIPV